MKKLIWLVGMVLCVCSWSLAYGQTADGQTPAEEKICDVLLYGQNEHVYGICNAFCEAKDCDSQKIFDKSCSQLLKNFIKNAQSKTPIPCLPDNFCTDSLGNYYMNKVEDCRKMSSQESCNNSFQPEKGCGKLGDDAVGCVWLPEKNFCTKGSKIDLKAYCCVDSFEVDPKPLEIRTTSEAYNY